MDLHIVGGFLGSGKTTAIIGAAKHLMAEGLRVGVVTNDQGRYLVDTAFFTLADVPAVEVTGGCFCCNYDDLEARLNQLAADAQPDVIFAESVGSCADIVATVVHPLLHLRPAEPPASFTVFADIRLLRRRLLGQPMPFNDDVVYIFDKQLEEAGLLVLNKRDLLSPEAAEEVLDLARSRFPDRIVLLQNSLEAAGMTAWIDHLRHATEPARGALLELDYHRYGAGEQQLAWLDAHLALDGPVDQGRATTIHMIESLQAELAAAQMPIGHLKVLIRWAGGSAKVSLLSLEDDAWLDALPDVGSDALELLVNARVQGDAGALRARVLEAVEGAAKRCKARVEARSVMAFHPSLPKPTHRLP